MQSQVTSSSVGVIAVVVAEHQNLVDVCVCVCVCVLASAKCFSCVSRVSSRAGGSLGSAGSPSGPSDEIVAKSNSNFLACFVLTKLVHRAAEKGGYR